MWSASQLQLPSAQEPDARAASIAVWVPWPLQPHSVWQSSPMKFPSQVHQ